METISKQAGQQFISTAQRLRYEGMEKGMERMAIMLISLGYSNKLIIESTKLSKSKIEDLREFYRINGKKALIN